MRLRQAFVEADEMAAVPVALTASEKHLLRAIIGTYFWSACLFTGLSPDSSLERASLSQQRPSFSLSSASNNLQA